MTQVLGLLLLAPELQEQVLHLEAVDGMEPLSERALRAAPRMGTWVEQRVTWAAIPTPARSESAAQT
jgi:hypothetical protein